MKKNIAHIVDGWVCQKDPSSRCTLQKILFVLADCQSCSMIYPNSYECVIPPLLHDSEKTMVMVLAHVNVLARDRV